MKAIAGYTLIKLLQDGRAGKVFLACKDARLCILKACEKKRCSDDVLKNELSLLQAVQGHPNVINLHCHQDDARTFSLEVEYHSYGSLSAFLDAFGALGEVKAAPIIRGLLHAVVHVHACHVLHRDIKPDNVCLAEDGRAVLIDFGISCSISETGFVLPRGTPGYAAPEVLLQRPYGEPADLFGIGATLYHIFGLQSPFHSKSSRVVMGRTVSGSYEFGEEFGFVSNACKTLISALLTACPSERLRASEALTHRWFAESPREAALQARFGAMNQMQDVAPESMADQSAESFTADRPNEALQRGMGRGRWQILTSDDVAGPYPCSHVDVAADVTHCIKELDSQSLQENSFLDVLRSGLGGAENLMHGPDLKEPQPSRSPQAALEAHASREAHASNSSDMRALGSDSSPMQDSSSRKDVASSCGRSVATMDPLPPLRPPVACAAMCDPFDLRYRRICRSRTA
eukprot:TRINITY_DN5295_c0_g1_i1.p1 TRINITY_DN5295_c0_g1~~TRINITY_DN5295_c0_g1_i1.p1  ORF type:complete len:460 (-),score=51.63 TRINITY_DN5295_c0_g1_i1:280-1659(-)